ncbi:MAG: bifunctional adenosylcobinamide kinase/adenosylcobinamide-phosphate guanylyltransferase [Candidatus Omnitrophota bacterium]
MKKFVFILGGARSGKSGYAVKLAKKIRKKTVFIATAVASDKEMAERIALHRASRPRQWKLIEEGSEINLALAGIKSRYGVVLIDCLGLLISNLMAGGLEEKDIEKKIKKLISTVQTTAAVVLVVSNDVGGGIVPENALARKFRDVLGRANQMMAEKADEVIFMQAGIPVFLKGRNVR